MVWWFTAKSMTQSLQGGNRGNQSGGSSISTQNAAAGLCDELVTLWRLAALHPLLSPAQRDMLARQFREWHAQCIEKVRKGRLNLTAQGTATTLKKTEVDCFPGFKPSIEACLLDWVAYPISNITYSDCSVKLAWRLDFKNKDRESVSDTKGNHGDLLGNGNYYGGARPKVHLSQVSGCGMKPYEHRRFVAAAQEAAAAATSNHNAARARHTDGSSSEGFCEAEPRLSKRDRRKQQQQEQQDSDSDLGADIGDLTLQDKAGFALHQPLMEACSSFQSRKFVEHSHSKVNNSGQAAAEALEPGTASSSSNSSRTLDISGTTLSGLAAAAGIPGPSGVKQTDHAMRQSNEGLAEGPQDEYQVYFYQVPEGGIKLSTSKVAPPGGEEKKKEEHKDYFTAIRKTENEQEVRKTQSCPF